MSNGLRIAFTVLLFSLSAQTLFGAELQTRYGPIIYKDAVQLQAYGRAIRPPLCPIYTDGQLLDSTIIGRHEFLFEHIATKLNIKVESLRVALHVAATLDELKHAYVQLAPRSTKNVIGFYSHLGKSIWISGENLSLSLVMHEISHAVLDHYFIQTVPTGVDEFLAESVERLF